MRQKLQKQISTFKFLTEDIKYIGADARLWAVWAFCSKASWNWCDVGECWTRWQGTKMLVKPSSLETLSVYSAFLALYVIYESSGGTVSLDFWLKPLGSLEPCLEGQLLCAYKHKAVNENNNGNKYVEPNTWLVKYSLWNDKIENKNMNAINICAFSWRSCGLCHFDWSVKWSTAASCFICNAQGIMWAAEVPSTATILSFILMFNFIIKLYYKYKYKNI